MIFEGFNLRICYQGFNIKEDLLEQWYFTWNMTLLTQTTALGRVVVQKPSPKEPNLESAGAGGWEMLFQTVDIGEGCDGKHCSSWHSCQGIQM